MKTSFIVNPNSHGGRGLKLWNRVRARLARAGVEYEIYFTASTGDAALIAKRLTEEAGEGRPTLYVIGGDGTLNELLNGIKHPDKVNVGYIPTSPEAGCARSLKLSCNPGRILRSCRGEDGVSRLEAMDYGVLTCGNGELTRRFAGSMGIGLDAAVCRRVEERLSIQHGLMGYFAPAQALREKISEVVLSKPVSGYLILDGERRVEFNHLMFVSVHIHPYEGKFKFGSYADPKDGMLEICAVSCKNSMKLLPILLRSRFRGNGSSAKVRFFQCREAHIHFDRPAPVHTDGECLPLQTDLDIRCVRQQFHIYR